MSAQAILLLIGAWLPLVITIGTLWCAIRLLYVPAGADLPWRWAWRSLVIGVLSNGLLWLRNALIVSGVNQETSWLVQWLMSLNIRVVLSIMTAAGFFGCAFYCYQIFRQRRPAVPLPAAQVIMNWKGQVIDWNQAATDLLGFTKADVWEQELASLIIPEEAREAHRQSVGTFKETAESRILNTLYPTEAIHKDGQRIKVYVHVTHHLTGSGSTFLGVITPRTEGFQE